MGVSMKILTIIVTIVVLGFMISCVSTDKRSHRGDGLMIEKIDFKSDGETLVGNLFLPKGYQEDNQYKAVVVIGSWTTVKEQMAGLYAEKFAGEGLITLAFDARGYGESEGAPKYFENPEMKIEDLKAAAKYMMGRDDVSSVGGFGVCAGAGYLLVAASEDNNISAVVTAASWIHDDEAVKIFYGGEEGVKAKVSEARSAREKFISTGEIEYIKTISTEDKTAAMYGPYDYYINPKRGAIKEWSSDKFAVMSWDKWLEFNPRRSAKNLEVPTMMIHSDGAVLPDYTKKYYEEIKTSDKELIWVETELGSPMHQFNFYDQDAEVELTVKNGSRWFNDKLK